MRFDQCALLLGHARIRGWIKADEFPDLNSADFNCFGGNRLQVCFRDRDDTTKFYEFDRLNWLEANPEDAEDRIKGNDFQFVCKIGADEWTTWEFHVEHY